MHDEVKLNATLTCPACGHKETVEMPVDACQYFYRCRGCSAIIKPKPGECCVFCSYANVKCPPKQMEALRE